MNLNNENAPVLIIFFNRPGTLSAVFDAVKKAKPKVLLLAQDGPREGKDDLEKIKECRKIVENVDWDCTVYKNYSETNLSCDHREFTAITWAFTIVDRLIILEDDCVPSPTFFPFCTEMLERYKDDKRVDRICGFNRIEKYEDVASDYFFSTISSGYGWGTWKRCWDEIERSKDYAFLDDEDLINTFLKSQKTIVDWNYGDIISQCKKCRDINQRTGKISSWENLVGIYSMLNHSLIITPKYNMVRNIGAVEGSTHYADLAFVNSSVRKMLKMPAYDLTFPLKHPTHVIRDVNYEKKHYKRIHNSPIKKTILKLEVVAKRLIHGDFNGIKKAIIRRVKKGE